MFGIKISKKVKKETESKPDSEQITKLPKNYKPTDKEKFMNSKQLEYFRQKLLKWRKEVVEDIRSTLKNMQSEEENKEITSPDEVDRATDEHSKSIELQTRNRESFLIKQIDAALDRIKNGTYGYCLVTGDKIPLERLEARPIATMTLEAQEEHEEEERKFTEKKYWSIHKKKDRKAS
jgi:DnaK suppressor protein